MTFLYILDGFRQNNGAIHNYKIINTSNLLEIFGFCHDRTAEYKNLLATLPLRFFSN